MIPAVVLAWQLLAWPLATAAQATDPAPHLLLGLETALDSGGLDAFLRVSAPALPADQRDWLARTTANGSLVSATLRERSRSSAGVLADVFLSYGSRAVIASWWIALDGDPAQIRSIEEISRFDGLIALTLDETRQFAVEDLTIEGPDFVARLPSGVAFVSESAGGTTALVLRGRTEITFTPADAAEQGQLVIFTGEPTLTTTADEVFVRVHPDDFRRMVSWRRMEARPVDAAALERARAVFDQRAGLSYHLDLGDMAPGTWSLEPGPASLLVEFDARRHGWLTYARSPEDPEDVSLFDRARFKQISLYRSASAASDAPRSDAAFSVRHTDLDLTFDPARQWLSGRASLALSIGRPLSSLTLKLADQLHVASVWSPELGPLLPLRTAGYDALVLALPGVVEAGRTVTIDVQYHGRLAPLNLSQENLRVEADAPQDPRPFADLPISYEPRYLYSQRSWWYPQTEAQRYATASIRLTVPESLHAIATGRLMANVVSPAWNAGDEPDGFVRTFTYATERPVRYLSCLIARLVPIGHAAAPVPAVSPPPGARVTDTAPSAVVDASVMVAPGPSRHMRTTPARVASMIEFYAGLAGAAPYPSFTVAALESALPGGHSPAYFAMVNQSYAGTPLSWARDPVTFREAPDFFLAHEVAHQWWGQAIGGTDYHAQWISEGFAQYFAWLYVTSTEGDETGHRMMARMRATSEHLSREGPIHMGFRLGHLRGNRRIFRAIVYNKSAVVLHMLRRLIGDEAFFGGLRRLYAGARFTAIDVADVERAFQAGTAVPLARFFTRWIRETGAPTLALTWTRAPAGDTVIVTASQSGETFDVPYDVTVQYEDGTRETITLRITEPSARFPIDARGPVRRVTFDDDLTMARVIR